jgi:hypothetical protein
MEKAARLCSERGALQATIALGGSEQGCESIGGAIPEGGIDLLINAASATSQLRDNQIPWDKLAQHVSTDLLWPLQVADCIWARQPSHPFSIILVSSILALVRSPNRGVYSALKRLQEAGLRAFVSGRPGASLLVVYLGKILPTRETTPATTKFATAVQSLCRRPAGIDLWHDGQTIHRPV